MNKIKDALYCWKKAFLDTLESAQTIPVLLVCLLAYQLVQTAINTLLARLSLGFLSGFISYLVTIAVTAHLAKMLSEIIYYKRLRLKDVGHFSQGLFYGVMNTLFVVYIFEWILELIIGPMLIPGLFLAFIFNLLMSAVLETVYIGQRTSMDAVQNAFQFALTNWLQWTVPNVLFSLVLSWAQVSGHLLIWISSPQVLLISMFRLLFVALILIFKGHLYRILATSSERKRTFQNQFRGWS